MFISTLLALFSLHPSAIASVAPPPVVLHLAIQGTYEVSEKQIDRVGERLARANPGARVIRLIRDRGTKSFPQAPYEMRELGYDLETRLNDVREPIGLVVVQAPAEDFEALWDSLDANEFFLGGLRNHLTADARVVFTGAPAIDTEAHPGQVRALFEVLGNARGTFLAATTAVHTLATGARARWTGLIYGLAAVTSGTALASISYVPRDNFWVDAAYIAGGAAWIIGDLIWKLRAENRRQARLPVEQRKTKLMATVINPDNWIMGYGIAGTLAGLAYKGLPMLDQTFAIWSVGLAGAAAAALAYANHPERLMTLLRPKLTNRARLFTADGTGEDVRTEDAVAFTCPALLTSG